MSETYRAHVDPDAPNNPHSNALRLVGRGHRVLEVGCWTGHVTEHLVAADNTVVGVEIDADAAAEAERYADRVHVVDLDRVRLSSIESARFDVILLGDVLEHLHDPAATLADLVTLLDDDGRLVISVPNVAHADVRLHLLSGGWDYQPDGLLDRTHVRWFTRAGLRDLLADVGFVASRLEPVVQPLGASGLPLGPAVELDDVRRFVAADPDSAIYQFVVEARRGEGHGALADVETGSDVIVAEAQRRAEHLAELERTRTSLEAELDAWRRSRMARWTARLRAWRSRSGR